MLSLATSRSTEQSLSNFQHFVGISIFTGQKFIFTGQKMNMLHVYWFAHMVKLRLTCKQRLKDFLKFSSQSKRKIRNRSERLQVILFKIPSITFVTPITLLVYELLIVSHPNCAQNIRQANPTAQIFTIFSATS